MDESVKSIFDRECAHLSFDTKLANKLSKYRLGFELRNQDHITFFGGNLTGVQVVRFLPEDRDLWFEDIIEAGEFILTDELDKVSAIDKSRVVTSDTMNLSFVWMLHRLLNSKLPEKIKHAAMIDVCMIMQFKFLTSRLYRHFRFPADPTIAAATYAQLSYKYAIKQYGSWKELLLARSEDIISKKSIHYKTFLTMDDDNKVTYVLSDVQGRIREMLKNIYDVHLRVKNQNSRILTTSSLIEYDGEIFLKDVTNNLAVYNRYIHSIITDKRSFIKEELKSVIEKLVHTMSPRMFEKTLEWMSHNYRQKGAESIEEGVTNVILYSLDYLKVNKSTLRNLNDLPGMLSKLRGSFMSSRNTDPLIVETKKQFEDIVHQATGSKHTGIIASVRTGAMLYVVARTLTKKHYSVSAIITK